MTPDKMAADAQALIKLHIDELARHHSKCIESDFARVRIEAACRMSPGGAGGSGSIALAWPVGVGGGHLPTSLTGAGFVVRTPGGVELYRSNPIYINVPAILVIWLRSTTAYRLARRIWVGERG